MLFKQKHLEGIKDGSITLAFRKWRKPSAKAGSVIQTAVGQVEIINLELVTLQRITAKEARMAGFDNIDALMMMLNQYSEGDVYRMGVRYHSDDPRIALREETKLNATAYEALAARLARLDRYAKEGPWTATVLEAIKKNPLLRAADLALKTGYNKEWLKLNIRKLKNLGLTISHDTGYTLSPLGKALLERSGKQIKGQNVNKE